MHKIKTGTSPAAFHITILLPSLSYSAQFSSLKYSKPETKLRKTRFHTFIWDPATWNNFAANTEKGLESRSLSESKVKAKLLDFENELTFF